MARLSVATRSSKDLKLKKNLDCSSSGDDALKIAKSNVTVDLNGKKIIGCPQLRLDL